MNTLEYAAELRRGAAIILSNPEYQWWYSQVIGPASVYNWIVRLEGSKYNSPLDYLPNEEVSLAFLFLACALESGDLP